MVAVQVEVAPTYLAKRDILEDNTGSMHKVKDVFAGSSLYYGPSLTTITSEGPVYAFDERDNQWNQSYKSQTAQLCRNVGRSGRRSNSLEKS